MHASNCEKERQKEIYACRHITSLVSPALVVIVNASQPESFPIEWKNHVALSYLHTYFDKTSFDDKLICFVATIAITLR